MISHQTREDIISSIMGFEEFCVDKLKVSNASIIPSRLNSDVIENIFANKELYIMGQIPIQPTWDIVTQ
jgi:hypothetical protein